MSQQDWSSVVSKPVVSGTKTPIKLTTTTAAHMSLMTQQNLLK